MSQQLKMDDYFGDRIDSFGEAHLACALLLDVSGSMIRNNAIGNLNEGIRRFKEQVCADPIARRRVDVAIITFSSDVQIVSDFVPITEMPTPELSAYGYTDMAKGIQTAINMVNNRTRFYSELGTPCHKPWIFMITDGLATSSAQEMDAVAERIKLEESKGSHGRLSFWALGLADYDRKQLFSLTKRVMELRNQDFTGIFNWLSESMSTISQSHVGDRVKFGELDGKTVRIAKEDREISEDWY